MPDIKFVEKILPILKEQAGSEILSSSYGEPNLSGPPRCSGICIANSSDTTLHSPNRANIVYIYIFLLNKLPGEALTPYQRLDKMTTPQKYHNIFIVPELVRQLLSGSS